MNYKLRNKAEYERIYSLSEYNVSTVYEHIIRIRERFLKNIKARLLDHGFGNGVVSEYFQNEGFDVYGVETATAALDFVNSRSITCAGLKTEQFLILSGETNKLPFPDEYFGVVVSNQVLFFIGDRKDIDEVIEEFFRVLKPGGKIVCTVMAENNYLFTNCGVPPVPDSGIVNVRKLGRLTRNWYLYRFHNEDDVRKAFEDVGFSIDDLGYFDYKLLDVTCAKHYIVLAHKPC